MAGERLLMREMREILRLKWDCRLTQREIARAAGVGLGTVSEYLPHSWDEGHAETRLNSWNPSCEVSWERAVTARRRIRVGLSHPVVGTP